MDFTRQADETIAARVAQRFAAKRSMKPEKLQAIMLKLRKGMGTSVKVEGLLPVFDHLGGWTFEPMLYLEHFDKHAWVMRRPLREKNYYTDTNPNGVRAFWETAKRQEVSRLPSNEQLSPADRGKTFYMDVEEIQTDPGTGRTGFYYKSWTVEEGTRVKAPNGKVFEGSEPPPQFLDHYPSNLMGLGRKQRFSDWLAKDSPFLDQINEKLGTESYEAERERKQLIRRDEKSLATCPCCFGDFKLTPRTKHGKDKTMPGMVLHGYKRPGTGKVHGNCPGQDWPPFELSSEGTVWYLGQVEKQLDSTEKYLAVLKKGEMSFLPDARDRIRQKKNTSPLEWEVLLRNEVENTESTIRIIKSEMTRLQKKISSWKPEPLGASLRET